MACRVVGAKPLSEQMMEYCYLDQQEQTLMKFQSKFMYFDSQTFVWKYNYVPASMC